MTLRLSPLPVSRSLVQFGAPSSDTPRLAAEPAAADRRSTRPSADGAMAARHGAARPSAAFLTQLIAVRLNAETYRSRRRTSPDLAIAAYAATPPQVAAARLRALA